jgi:hypothetical protein
MAKIERFEDLEIWNEAIVVGVKIYKLCETGKLKNDFSAKDPPTTPIQFLVPGTPAPVEISERSSGLLVARHKKTRTATAPTIIATTSFLRECFGDFPPLFLSRVVPSARQKFMSSSL